MSALESMKVAELKELLKERELKVSGKKSELIERLIESGYEAGKVVTKTEKALSTHIRKLDLTLAETMKVVSMLYGLDFEYFADFLSEVGETKPEAEQIHIPETEEELEKLKVKELKEILKSKGEKVAGKKSELIERILALNEGDEQEAEAEGEEEAEGEAEGEEEAEAEGEEEAKGEAEGEEEAEAEGEEEAEGEAEEQETEELEEEEE